MSFDASLDPREAPWDGRLGPISRREIVRVLVRFWRFARPYRGKFALSICMLLISVPMAQFALFLTRDVTNQALVASNLTADERWRIVLRIVGMQALLWLGSALLSTYREVLEWYGSMRSTFDLRLAFYRHLHRLPMSFLSRRAPGEHLYRSTADMVSMFRAVNDGKEVGLSMYSNDVDPYDPGIMGMIFRSAPLVVETIYSLLWGAALLYLIDPVLSLALAVYVVPFAVISHYRYAKVRKAAFSQKLRAEHEAGHLRDTVASARTLKSFAREKTQFRRFFAAATRTRRRGIQMVSELAITQSLAQGGLKWAFSGVIYVYVAARIMRGQATVGDWLATFLLIEAAQIPLEKLVQLLQLIRMQLVPAQRVLETLDEAPRLQDRPGARGLGRLDGDVEFRDVSFGYDPHRPILHQVSFQVRPGEYLGIVGPSGAGKSSIIALLLRLYAPDAGVATVDGIDVQDLKLQSLLDQVGAVPQSTFLYEGTVLDNVLFGNPRAEDAVLRQALMDSGVAEFIARLPRGLDTPVGEGALISGGERQRIGLARALIRQPKLLILDEATASLDPITEAAVIQSIESVRRGITTISIAHRLKAVAGCDRILVMQAGRIVQEGRHEALRATPGLYRSLWEEQSTAEARAA